MIQTTEVLPKVCVAKNFFYRHRKAGMSTNNILAESDKMMRQIVHFSPNLRMLC